MNGELDNIDLLEEFSNSIAKAKEQTLGVDDLKSQSSFSAGLTLDDLADDNKKRRGKNDSKRIIRNYLESWQTLVQTQLKQKLFLDHAANLSDCTPLLVAEMDADTTRQIRCLINLMVHTIENNNLHDSTELRYATLLEIILSYKIGWRPSTTLNDLWADLELHIEEDCEAYDFRRVAYKVLISRAWGSPSCELYTACSYDPSESMSSTIPPHLATILDKVGTDPLLRSDRVHQVLEEIGDEGGPYTIVINYSDSESFSESDYYGQGMGKTTLAALLAVHPTIAEFHSIFWVDLHPREDDSPLPYNEYIKCLKKLCEQLGTEQNWPDKIMRLEDESLVEKRNKEHMQLAKRSMTKLFLRASSRVLIVIDGANDEDDYEWFRFVESQSTIVITKAEYIPETTYTVEMEPFGEDEGLALFALEAAQDRDDPIFHTVEAKTIIRQCLYHPLIIRTAAHWFKLKQVTSGLSKGLEELNLELSVLRHTSKSAAPKVLGEVIDMMLNPTKKEGIGSSSILKLCLSGLAVVFSDKSVPLDAILEFWSKQIFTNQTVSDEVGGENIPAEELRKRLWFVAETFIHFGFLSVSEEGNTVMVRLHHRMYVDYGRAIISEVQSPDSTTEETEARWHGCFVAGYNARLKALKTMPDLDDKSRHYVLKEFITHMMESKSVPKVIDMLKDERFCRERIKVFGFLKAAKFHVDDCLLLRQRAIESKSAKLSETRKVILSCLKKFASILGEETLNLSDQVRIEKARALHLVGFTQASDLGYSEALTQYKNALHIMPNQTHPFNAVVMYSQAVLQLMRNDHEKGIKKIKGCQKNFKDNGSLEISVAPLLQVELIQLRGDALAAGCDYVGAEIAYDEALNQGSKGSKIETGTALYRRGRLHQIVGELDQSLSAITESINWKGDIGEEKTTNLADAFSATGDIFLEMDKKPVALKQYERALELLKEIIDETNEIERILLYGKIQFLKENEKSSKDAFNAARKQMKIAPRLLMDRSAYELRCVGKIYREWGEDQLASEIFEEALELTKEKPESLERASILYELGYCLFGFGNTKDTIVCFEEALKIRKSKLGECELVLDTQVTLGKIYRKLNMHQECLGVAKEVMFLTEKLYKDSEEKIAGALFGVGESYEILKEYDQAVATFEECKETLKRAFRPSTADIANVLQRLGKLHASYNNFDKAYNVYMEALDICRAKKETETPQFGETLYFLGVTARKRGDYNSAKNYLQEALDIYKQLEMSRETCLSLIELGNVWRILKEADTAVMCYERCLTYMDPADSEDSMFGNLYLSFGHARLTRSEIAEATECYDNALKNRTERLGRDHAATAKAARSMGIVKYLSNSFAEAKIYLNDFIRVMEFKRTLEDIDYVIALQLLGEVHHSERQFDEAKAALSKSKSILQQYPSLQEEIPEIEEMLSIRLKAVESAPQEKKGFFSRFTELARFEDEAVSREEPVEEKIQRIIRNRVFIDEDI